MKAENQNENERESENPSADGGDTAKSAVMEGKGTQKN